MSQAVQILEPTDWDAVHELPYAVIYRVARDYFKQYMQVVNSTLLRTLILDAVANSPDLQTPYMQSQLDQLLYACVNMEAAHIVTTKGMELLQLFIDERKVYPVANQVASGNFGAVDMVEQMSRVVSSTRVSTTTAIEPFSIEQAAMDEDVMPKRGTGLRPFDVLLGGGIRSKELILLLGPIGGGKTLMSINSALSMAAQAKEDEVVLFLTYEQAWNPIMRERIWTAATQLPRSEFEGKRVIELKPETRERLQKKQEVFKRLRFVDMTTPEAQMGEGSKGVLGIQSVIQQELSKGRKVRALFVDWLRPMVQAQMAAKNQDATDITPYLGAAMLDFKQLNQRFDCNTIVTHQLNADAATRNPELEFDMYAGSDNRMLAQYCDSVYVFSVMISDQRLVKITNAKKSRNTGVPTLWCTVTKDTHQIAVARHQRWILNQDSGQLNGYAAVPAVTDSTDATGSDHVAGYGPDE